MKKNLQGLMLILCISIVFSSCMIFRKSEEFIDEFNSKFDERFDEMEEKFEKKFDEKFNESSKYDENTIDENEDSKAYSRNKNDNLANYNVDDFTTLHIKTPKTKSVNLIYINIASDILQIDASDKILSKTRIYVEDGKLVLDFKTRVNNSDIVSNEDITIYISPASLKEIEVTGALNFNNSDTLKMAALKLEVSGAADIQLDLDVTELDIEVAGALDGKFTGKADKVNYEVAGATEILALELITKNTDIEIAGAGTISCNVSDNLDINIAGIGAVEYRGNPNISGNNSPIVSVKPVN